jgi:hypothetical protein
MKQLSMPQAPKTTIYMNLSVPVRFDKTGPHDMAEKLLSWH